MPLTEALAPDGGSDAAQRPVWTSGSAHGYHGRTWGWLVGGVTVGFGGRTPGCFFAEEIAVPLRLDFFIGLPTDERDRSSHMVHSKPEVDLTSVAPELVPVELREQVAAWRDPNSLCTVSRDGPSAGGSEPVQCWIPAGD